jgi:hypothetical protein
MDNLKNMSSNLDVKQGIYDPTKRFAFKNITKEDFTFYWNSTPITVKADEEVELPHHLAVLATRNLVDKIMMADIHEEEVKMKAETKNPYYRSPRGLTLGVPAMREPIEKKILRELTRSESKVTESQLGIIRSELKENLVKDLTAKNSTGAPSLGGIMDLPKGDGTEISNATSFADLNVPLK